MRTLVPEVESCVGLQSILPSRYAWDYTLAFSIEFCKKKVTNACRMIKSRAVAGIFWIVLAKLDKNDFSKL